MQFPVKALTRQTVTRQTVTRHAITRDVDCRYRWIVMQLPGTRNVVTRD
jgi:hypothetical protein